ncbi:serine protease [Acaryochloris sp. CCMEE 5410]|uniref:tetratricopeptide repeat-containing S1 family peptidase n=1 Tax=Acaryochloris sp. CCMEE 5410 TaxID=310037 RepID=UPI0002484FEC|nr:serine protease [Acaryochloris sp. CCMEE 5410]KAI9134944.1 trypsin-like peptidase domain-containing protein [Acaryochloris sp. CCMEE 5410]
MNIPQKFSTLLLGTVAAIVLAPQVALALSPAEINKVAKQITVRVDSQAPGSGVIIKRNGNRYTVLTAAHVVATVDEYVVITNDGQEYPVNVQTITKFPGVDLALLEFTSDRSYTVVKIGDSQQLSEGSESYVAGFPSRTQALTDIIYNFTTGTITANATRPLSDGYALVYTNNTLPGMSGGPVLDKDGKLLGIHGRADTTTTVQNQNINPDIFIKTGFNLGIPIHTFLKMAPANTVTTPIKPIASVPSAPSSASDFYLQALDQYRLGNMAGALRNTTQAIRQNPQFAPAYALRGSIRLVKQDQTGALQDFNQAIQLDKNLLQAYIGRALVQSSLGDTGGAIADYSQAIQLQGDHAILYYNRGIVYLNQGQQGAALTDLRTAADLALKDNNQADYQRALEAINIASKNCRQSIRTICDR